MEAQALVDRVVEPCGKSEAPKTRPLDIAKSSWMLTLASIAVVIAACTWVRAFGELNEGKRQFMMERLRDWDFGGDLNKAIERIGCDAVVVTTLVGAQEQVRLLASSSGPNSQLPSELAPIMMAKALP